MELACQVFHGHFEPVNLLQASKIDDEKRCFLKFLKNDGAESIYQRKQKNQSTTFK